MRQSGAFSIAASIALIWASQAHTHHSIFGTFDGKNRTKITGEVTKIEWSNPHVRIFVSAKNPENIDEEWIVETESAGGLQGRGWNRQHLRVGEQVTVRGPMARDGGLHVYVNSITLSTGRLIFFDRDKIDALKLPAIGPPDATLLP